MATKKFAEFEDPRPGDEVSQRLRAAGYASTNQEWLVSFVLGLGDPVLAPGAEVIKALCRLRLASSCDERALIGFLVDPPPSLPPEQASTLTKECASHGLLLGGHFTGFLEEMPRGHREWPERAGVAVRLGVVNPEHFIDWGELRRKYNENGWIVRHHCGEEQSDENRDIQSLVFWLVADQASALRCGAQHLDQCELNEIPATGHAFCRAVQTWILRGIDGKHYHPESYRYRGSEFAALTETIFRSLFQRTRDLSEEERQVFSALLLRLHWMSFDGRERELPEQDRKELVSMATKEVGLLRGKIRSVPIDEAKEWLTLKMDEYRSAIHAIFSSGSLWQGLKAALLLFRALPVPSVAPDLRWWMDKSVGDDPPSPWNQVTESMVYMFHAFARKEQHEDKDLLESREGFADYCLDRLKTRKQPHSNGGARGLVEPDPNWRVAYIRALSELKVNPGGKGHRILHVVSESDPDPDVRDAAKNAYADVRHGVDLPPGFSPRRAVLMATWWLRQGHLLSFGQSVDEPGARLTAQEEIRMTQVSAQ